ncbi:MAG: hypothetical protein WC758_06415 [Candidatus Woesearchaeota archaeon]|jgi:hypothetical protein
MSSQGSDIMFTGVDRLIDLLKKMGQIDVSEAAERLNYPPQTIQSWVDFLVEEKIIGVEYQLTKPYIYLIVDKTAKDQYISLKEDFKYYKKDFQNSVKSKSTNADKAEFEWKEHILRRLDLMKQFFFTEADKRKLKNPEKLWEKYRKKTTLN